MAHGTRSDFFLYGPSGKQIHYDAYRQYLEDTAAKTVPDKQVTPHTLRHTCCSLLAEAGVPLEVISRRLGHHDSSITKEVYLHVTKHQEEKDRELLKHVDLL